MADRNSIYVDLSTVTTKEALHETLKTALLFPDYYGGNLDALHDCLTDIRTPTEITFAGYKAAKKALESDFYAFRNVVEDSADENENLTIQWRRRK